MKWNPKLRYGGYIGWMEPKKKINSWSEKKDWVTLPKDIKNWGTKTENMKEQVRVMTI